jgi:drug/metabolite transporter (DMT)-like permease
MTRALSFRERLAWSSLGGHVAVFLGYFLVVAKDGPTGGSATAAAIVLAGLVVLTLAMRLAARFEAPRDQARPDEREHLIDLKAARIAGLITAVGASGVIIMLLTGYSAVFAANIMLGTLVLAQMGADIARITHFKIGV